MVSAKRSGRGAGIAAQAELIARLAAPGLDVRDLKRGGYDAQNPRCRGPYDRPIACPQGAHRLGAHLRVLREAFPAGRYHCGRGCKAFAG